MSSQRVIEARHRIGQARDLKDVTARLLAAAPSFHAALSRRRIVGNRPDLGLRVRSIPGTYSGLTAPGVDGHIVVIRSHEATVHRRLALAHELGHQLLADVDRSVVGLDIRQEEWLCERFAEYALVPAGAVRAYFSDLGVPRSTEELRKFCRHFKVGINTAVRRLSSLLDSESNVALLTATVRKRSGYAERPTYRVDRAACPPRMLIPRDRRLSSWGLTQVLEWAATATPGVSGDGVEHQIAVRSRVRGIANWVGAAPWTSFAVALPASAELDAPGLLIVLDVSLLQPAARDPFQRPRGRRRGVAGPTQLRMPVGP
jgi:hypothetical protein